ncbi:hypothetical protein GGX14DRAFT_648820 [Mycena pura]|uniref:Uncharacterized protein n=1 Tax=Mycena pura TaxID=153505 RepID=A0AAD6YMS1_9AGAR|nr:hypothetical protein GGX14DRAFT_648820 [Mycena pura]
MILPDSDKEHASDATSIPLDAPPTYEASTSNVATASYPTDTKRHPSTPASPVASGSNLASSSSGSITSPSAATSWFNFASPTVRQVRATILGLVRDLVKLQPSDHSVVAISILKSCADACATNGLSISTILQEKSVEGHTPLYWAIVKRPAESPEQQEGTDLLTTLLSLSTPLIPATISDIRLACLLTSDQVLFQRLRNSHDFAPLSPTDQMLLDATTPPDEIAVENVPTDEFAFAADFVVVRFQKRMLVSKAILLDFIARGRMFRLGFHVSELRRTHLPPPGAWYASLSLLEHSPPTWIDSRLIVPAPSESAAESSPNSSGFASGFFGSGKPRPRPTLSARMKATEQLCAPGRHSSRRNQIILLLDGADSDGGLGGLQYAGCPYLSQDETLRFRLEARLTKPEAECVIC